MLAPYTAGVRPRMKAAYDLLKALTKRLPPSFGCRHALTLSPDDPLDVYLQVSHKPGAFLSFGIEPADFERPIEDLVAEILEYLEKEASSENQ